jgi:hypothetical protein
MPSDWSTSTSLTLNTVNKLNCDNSAFIITRLSEESRFDSWQAGAISLFSMAYRLAPSPTQLPIEQEPKCTFHGSKVSEFDYSPLSIAKTKNAWSYTSTHPHVFMVWCLLSIETNYICNNKSATREIL